MKIVVEKAKVYNKIRKHIYSGKTKTYIGRISSNNRGAVYQLVEVQIWMEMGRGMETKIRVPHTKTRFFLLFYGV